MEQDTGMEQLKESEEENTSDWNQNRGQQVERTHRGPGPTRIATSPFTVPGSSPCGSSPVPAHCLAGLRRDLPCCFLAARSSFQYAPPEAGAQGAAPREATGYRDGAGQTMKG